MLKRFYVNSVIDNLKTALEECPILSDCTISIDSGILSITDSNGHRLFECERPTNSSTKLFRWRTYASNESYAQSRIGTDSGSAYGYFPYCYVCDNGAVIYTHAWDSNHGMPIRIVKTNDNRIAFISYQISSGYPAETTKGFKQDLQCIAWGDIEPFKWFDIPNRYDTHAMVVPMLTNSDANVVSYTVKSGFMPYSTQDAAMKVIDIAGKKYLADGYFAIEFEDSEETEES